MARLPQPGGDDGSWGNVLNDFLTVAHNTDGGIKADAVSASAIQDNSISGAKLQDSSVTTAKLDTSNSPGSGQVLSYDGSGLAWSNTGGGGDPTMGGDLSGLASNAQIVAGAVGAAELATNAVTTIKILDSNVTDAKIASGVSQSKITNLTSDLAGKEPTITAATTSDYYRGDKSFQPLNKAAVGLANVDNTSDADKPVSTATQTALNGKASTSTTISAGTGLTGGGDLSANRTLTVSYGTTAGTAAQGNDSRITGAEQTANKGVANGYAGLNSSTLVPTAQLGTGTANSTTFLRGDGSWAAPAESAGLVTLSDGATIATDASAGKHFRVSISGDRTLGVPTNPTDGMRRIWEITASAANRTLTLSTGTAGSFELTTNITSPIVITSGKTLFLGAVYNATRDRWTVLASQATS